MKPSPLGLILVGLFSFSCVDLRFYKSSPNQVSSKETSSLVLSRRKEKLKRKQRKYKNKKFKRNFDCYVKKHKFRSSQTKSTRHLNQRSLRRMYRNC